jgi:hypothetical protein
MTRTAIIKNNVVIDVQEFSEGSKSPRGVKAVATNVGNIGDAYDGAGFLAPQQARTHWSFDQLSLTLNNLTTKLLREPRDVSLGDVTVFVDAKPGTRADLAELSRWGAANPGGVRIWIDARDNHTKLTGAQYVALATVVGDYVLRVYEIAAQVTEGLTATPPTIATDLQIFDAFGLRR